jgi:hypothetical protein
MASAPLEAGCGAAALLCVLLADARRAVAFLGRA